MRSYDLLLQSREPHAPIDLPAVLEALLTRGLEARGAGWVVVLPSKELELVALREGGVPIAVELRVPLAEQTKVLEEALGWGVDAAKSLDLRLLDPQLGCVVTGPSAAVSDEFLRAARYAGEYVGVSDAVGVSSLAELHHGTTFATRLVLAAVVFLVFVWGGFKVVGALRAPAEAPAAGRSR